MLGKESVQRMLSQPGALAFGPVVDTDWREIRSPLGITYSSLSTRTPIVFVSGW